MSSVPGIWRNGIGRSWVVEAPGTEGLIVEDLQKRYADGTLIGPLSFRTAPGEFFSLLGPSGCGKTTTLKCIAGIETPTAGRVRLGDLQLDTLPANKRPVGIVFQNLALFPHLTVGGNIAFGLRLRKLDAPAIQRAVREIAEQVEVSDLLDRLPSEISGGQQQRVAVARSLVLKPRLLLLDEPLSALDAKLRLTLRAQLKELQRRAGITFVYVTHDQAEALSMSDRVAVFNTGRIEQIGKPVEVYGRPASRFVAEFVGEGTFLEADGEGRLQMQGGGALNLRGVSRIRKGAAVFVRPEAIVVEPSERTVESFTIRQILYEGAATKLVIEGPGGGRVAALLSGSAGPTAFEVGSPVVLFARIEEVIAMERQ